MEIEKILTTVGIVILGFAALFGTGAAFINGFNPVEAAQNWVSDNAPWVNELIGLFGAAIQS